jgi:hypothetical protein
MDKQVHELTWAMKRLQLVVDRALDSVRPLRQASDTLLREYRACDRAVGRLPPGLPDPYTDHDQQDSSAEYNLAPQLRGMGAHLGPERFTLHLRQDGGSARATERSSASASIRSKPSLWNRSSPTSICKPVLLTPQQRLQAIETVQEGSPHDRMAR